MDNLHCVKPPDRMLQDCPLCGQRQVIQIRGIVADLDDGVDCVVGDRGYSFCNCRNIFFTNYDNIDKSIYDERYYARHDNENITTVAGKEISKFWKVFTKYNPEAKTFLEIGSIHDHILDYAKEQGLETTGIDIFEHKKAHTLIVTDFEYYEPDSKYDIVHASHIFEHFENPGIQLDKCKSMLNHGGLLYISMPDTFFIDFTNGNALNWDWRIQEHYILWNMENFIEYAEEHGLKCLHKERGLDLFGQSDNKWLWKKDFKVVFTHG